MENKINKRNNSLHSPHHYNSSIFMPNEIFNDLQNAYIDGLITNNTHIHFLYSYYYLISYLYRYCHYGNKPIMYTQSDIKQALGYAPNNKKIDYLIKKDGVLDTMGYTSTTTDIPLSWYMNDNNDPEFNTLSDMDSVVREKMDINKNFKIKLPVKAFYRDDESKAENINTGTFYDVSNTHEITESTFKLIKELTQSKKSTVNMSILMYYYGYIKMKSKHYDGYQAPVDILVEELFMSDNSIMRCTKFFEESGLLKVEHVKYVHNQRTGKANVYLMN